MREAAERRSLLAPNPEELQQHQNYHPPGKVNEKFSVRGFGKLCRKGRGC